MGSGVSGFAGMTVYVGWREQKKQRLHAKAGRDWDYPRSVKLCRAQNGSGKTASRAQDIWGLIGTELQ